MEFRSPAMEFRSPAFEFLCPAMVFLCPAMGFPSLAVGFHGPAVRFQSPAVWSDGLSQVDCLSVYGSGSVSVCSVVLCRVGGVMVLVVSACPFSGC